MSVLKIKDQNNNWTQIPTIKGEKGDPFTYADFTTEQLESLKGKDGISPTVSVASDTSEDYRLSFTDETHTVTTPNLIPEAEKILSVYPHDIASGAVASFSDGADNIPLKSCIVRVEPVQAGSGDPSPDNVRPISGWTGVNINNFGKNCISNGAERQSITTSIHAKYTPVVSLEDATSVTFSVSADVPSGQTLKLYCWTGKNNWSVGSLELMPDGRYALTNADIIKLAKEFRIYSQPYTGGSSVVTTVWDCTCVINETRTDYVPYVGRAYPITFPTEAGTVYGGYIDVINGELVVDRVEVTDLGTLSWSYGTQTNPPRFFALLPYSGKNDPWWVKDAMLSTGEYTLGENVGQNGADKKYGISANFIYFTNAEYTNKDDFKASITGTQVVYRIATPIHYPLAPIEIKTLLGQNNIWADTGDTEVEYRASTKMYIDRKITEAVASALNS